MLRNRVNEPLQSADNQIPEQPRKVAGYIERLVEETLPKLQTLELRTSYARALLMSVELNEANPETPRPCSPEQIRAVCGFNTAAQKRYSISLDKTAAIKFFEDFMDPEFSGSSFRKRNTAKRYEELFGRLATLGKRKGLICTYAEWLHLEDFLFEPELPPSIVDLLNGWKVPSEMRSDDRI